MDWTSVYDEDGSEDLIIPHLMQAATHASRLSRLASSLAHHYEDMSEDEGEEEREMTEGHRLLNMLDTNHHHIRYSLREVYFLSINYILGVGCLGIPYAFARAGFLLCGSILLTVTIFSFMTVLWVAETGVRFEEQMKHKNSRTSKSEKSPLVAEAKDSPTSQIGGRYEVIDLVEFYLGWFQKYLYQLSLLALMGIGLLAYSQVFCGAIAAVIWPNPDDVWNGVPQLLFGLMVIPLSCMELEEQVSIQAIMATARFVAIFAIVFGSWCALFWDDSYSNRSHPPYFASSDQNDGAKVERMMSYTATFSGFGIAFSASLFSQLFQVSGSFLLYTKAHSLKILSSSATFSISYF